MPAEKHSQSPIPWHFFLFEAAMFALTLVLGIASSWRARKIAGPQDFIAPPLSLWQLFAVFLLATAALLFIIYYFRFRRWKGRFLRIIFSLTVIFGNFFFFSIWLPGIFALLLPTFFLFLFFKSRSVLLHNLAIILAAAAVGSGFGMSLEPSLALLMLLVFALYDFAAVYFTKHMVKLAGAMIESEAVVGLIIPKKTEDFQSSVSAIKEKGRFMILGAGDVVLPLVLAVSLLTKAVWAAVLIAVFALLGLFAVFLLFLFQKEKQPLPALPPIVLSCSFAYFIISLL